MGEDVQADQIKGAERRTLRTANRGTGYLVNFFNRVVIGKHRLNRNHCTVSSDAISDEVRAVLSRHHTFAKTLIEEPERETRNLRLGPRRANYFDQVQVAGRIKKVNAKKVFAEIV